MQKQISGMGLHLKFSFVCAMDRLRGELITQESFDELERCVKNNIDPDEIFMWECFPDAHEDYIRCCMRKGVMPDWSYESVAEYWHYNHNKTGYCAVTMQVVRDLGEIIRVMSPDGKNSNVTNDYETKVETGEYVWIHRGSIIHKSE